MPPNRLRRLAHQAAHGASLVLTAWALMATSETPPGGAASEVYYSPSDCFALIPGAPGLSFGVGDPTFTTFNLWDGAPTATAPSCGGLDGLVKGAHLTFSLLSESNAGAHAADGGVCLGYDTLSVVGLPDLKFQSDGFPTSGEFAVASGSFVQGTNSACRGDVTLSIVPPVGSPDDVPISPLDDGGATWTITRTLQLDQPGECGPPFSASGPFTCTDTYTITSVGETNP